MSGRDVLAAATRNCIRRNSRWAAIELLMPGIKINTGPDDFAPIKSMHLRHLVRERWRRSAGYRGQFPALEMEGAGQTCIRL